MEKAAFFRPVEYDPALLEEVSQGRRGLTKHDAMVAEFGLDPESESEGGDSDQEREVAHARGGSQRHQQHVEEGVSQEEFERLHESLQEAQEARTFAEQLAKKAEDRVKHLQQMSKQATSILNRKFTEQVRNLERKVEEQQSMLNEDDDTIEALRQQIAVMKSGGNDVSPDVQAKLNEQKEARALARDLALVKHELESAQNARKSMEQELQQVRAQLESGEQKKSQTNADTESQLEQREAELKFLKEDFKKRHNDRNKLVAKINELQTKLEQALAAADTAGTGKKPNGDIANGPVSAQAVVSSAEYKTLQARVRELENALKIAQSSQANGAATSPTNKTGGADPAEVAALKEEKSKLEEMCRQLNSLIERRGEEMKQLKEKAKAKLTQASSSITRLKKEYTTLNERYNQLKKDGSESTMEKQKTVQTLLSSVAQRKVVLNRMHSSCKNFKQAAASARQEIRNLDSLFPSMAPLLVKALEKKQAEENKAYSTLVQNYQKEMLWRRKLFNEIQELKGNIRVYCRVRPHKGTEDVVIKHPSEGEIVVENQSKKIFHSFEFERIFDYKSSQETVFSEVAPLITSVLDGFNVCIFAYGQTGSGKTHTMEGPRENPGVNTRALAKLFDEALEKTEMTYEFRLTLLEIYNENILDLLGDGSGQALKAVQGKNGMEVKDLRMAPVKNSEEVADMIKKGQLNRTVASTNCNERSSRSHLILTVYVTGTSKLTGKVSLGKLHLIDLAGSERISRSGVTGQQLEEAKAINSSLSALGNVISARANKSQHVPYRDSKLTFLLQDSLEKNSKTLMFVCCSPSDIDIGETVCSLRFAERVRKVELGKATANTAKKKKAAP